MLPFKSVLLSVAEYRATDGAHSAAGDGGLLRLDWMPMGRSFRPFIAWYGAMKVVPHLWTVLGLGDITVRVIFHPPVTLEQFGSRKALSAHCHKVIAAAFRPRWRDAVPATNSATGTRPETRSRT